MIDLAEDKRLQADEQERLKWAFDQLQIPLPTGNQHYHGGTRITFVTPAAVTIRLVQNKNTRLIRHPHVARPLGAIALSKRWRLDVIQGGETSVTHKEAKRIRDQLRKISKIADMEIYEMRSWLRGKAKVAKQLFLPIQWIDFGKPVFKLKQKIELLLPGQKKKVIFHQVKDNGY